MSNTGATATQRFAARMKYERKKRHWRQEDLAAAAAKEGLPLHATAFSKIESGQRTVTLNEAAAIAAVFGKPVGYMLISTNPGAIEQELEQARAELAEAQAASDAELSRAAAAWNRVQELTAALGQERGGYSASSGT